MEIWHNPSCSKSRMAKSALDAAGVAYSVRDYLGEPPTAAELTDLLAKLGLEPWQVTRTADAAKLGVTLPAAKDAEHRGAWIDTLVATPRLIQRPILVEGGDAWVARDDETVAAAVASAR